METNKITKFFSKITSISIIFSSLFFTLLNSDIITNTIFSDNESNHSKAVSSFFYLKLFFVLLCLFNLFLIYSTQNTQEFYFQKSNLQLYSIQLIVLITVINLFLQQFFFELTGKIIIIFIVISFLLILDFMFFCSLVKEHQFYSNVNYMENIEK